MASTALTMIQLLVMIGLLGSAVAAWAQNPEAGRVDRRGDRAVLIADAPRPLDSAAITLAQEFGIAISVEDPSTVFQGDRKDVNTEVSRASNPNRRVLIPKGGRLEIPFALDSAGMPKDVPGLIRDLVTAANRLLPFAYRVDTEGNRVTLVPTKSTDALGRITDVTPLLDRRVTIPLGTRPIAVSAGLMAEALATQTGMRVHCCQGASTGIPWGMQEIAFAANNEPARSVLMRLLGAAAPGQSDRAYWLQRCDFQPSGTCFVNLMFANRPAPVQTAGVALRIAAPKTRFYLGETIPLTLSFTASQPGGFQAD